MKKDVLFLCQFFYPEKVSSALLPFQTAVSLVRNGFTVDAICGYPKEYVDTETDVKKTEVIEGIGIYRKKYLQLARAGKIGRLINYFSFTIVILMNLIKFNKYKVIIVYSNPPIIPLVAVLANIIFGTKIIFVAYDLYPEIAESMDILSQSSLISTIMNKLNKQLYKRASRVIALSSEMKRYIVLHRKIATEKVAIIPNWATEKEIKNDSSVTTSDFGNIRQQYKLIVSYFGNMGTAQDMDTIRDIISNVEVKDKSICFLFAGHGNKKENLKSFIKESNLENCYVFDYLSGNEFEDALKVTDINIVSLEKNLAGLAVPSKTYSYYQSGSPIISIMSKTTDISKEIEGGNCGISIENGNSEPVVKWLLEMIERPEKIEVMRKNITRLHNEFYLKEYQMKKYIKLIKEVLSEGNHV